MNFVLLKRSIGIIVITVLINIFSTNISQAKTFDVSVSFPQFSPKDLTINVGDTVKWTNAGGTHNVDGNKSVYPNNPESFGNSVGAGWVYTFVFTVPGTYDYQCDPHASLGMVGTVTVESTNEVNESQIADNSPLNIFPNPAIETITISDLQLKSNSNPLRIYNNLGEIVFTGDISNNTINISNLPAGVYYLIIDNRTIFFTKLD